MPSAPLVSIVVPFYNTPAPFMREAIESVLQQTYTAWELLLVDDGSADESTRVARHFASLYPDRLRCLEHAGHRNLGASAARQLGIQASAGPYVAFLDSDDVWLPEKLEQQVAILESCPEAGMLYGNTLYWFSWAGRHDDPRRDYLPPLGVAPNTLVRPPALLAQFLDSRAAVPSQGSILVRRSVVQSIGGFEKDFPGLFDDQVFYAKVALSYPVFVSAQCWDKYRQRPGSLCDTAAGTPAFVRAHAAYLAWLEAYLVQRDCQDEQVWQALRRQQWLHRTSRLFRSVRAHDTRRFAKKWILNLEERLLPQRLRRRLWARRHRPQPEPPAPASPAVQDASR